jgi:MoaA/NifB/PqqE/SkfB family radical SAM enzyme
MSELGWKYLTATDRDAILRGVRDGVAYGGPYHVEIYPADRCNIDCFFCSTAAIRGTDELPLTRIEELMAECKEAGTRSVRLAGGGEPLFHRKTKDMLRAIAKSGLPLENITTNAVLLRDEIASILLGENVCDEIIVSLNTGDAETYASMMQTPARNFERVVENVRKLIAERKRLKRDTPKVFLQFLVWKGNYTSIPRMYNLARELDVDAIIFNGLSFLKPEQQMTAEETAAMLRLYEEVIRIDEFRHIESIGSFEQDIEPQLREITSRLSVERNARGRVANLVRFVTRRDVPLRQKLAHRRKVAALRTMERETAGMDEPCVIGWHSLVIRTTGMVAPCCILQASPLGNIFQQSLRDVWYGEPYAKFRRELSRIIAAGDGWNGESGETVVPMCAGKGSETCPIKSYYYKPDVAFLRELNAGMRA